VAQCFAWTFGNALARPSALRGTGGHHWAAAIDVIDLSLGQRARLCQERGYTAVHTNTRIARYLIQS
jgi:hypothetical protein